MSLQVPRWRVALATLFTLLAVALSLGAGPAHAASAPVTPDSFTNKEGDLRVTITPSASSKFRADITVQDVRGRAYSRATCGPLHPVDCLKDLGSVVWNGVKWIKRNSLNIARCSFAVAVAVYPGAKAYKFAKKLGGAKGVVELIAASRNEGVFLKKLKGKIGKNWQTVGATFLGIDAVELYCFGKK